MFRKKETSTSASAVSAGKKKGFVKKALLIIFVLTFIVPTVATLAMGGLNAMAAHNAKANRETFEILEIVSEDTVRVKSDKTGTEACVELFGMTAPVEDLQVIVGKHVAFKFDSTVSHGDKTQIARPYMIDVDNERVLQMELLAAGIGTNNIPFNASLRNEYINCETYHSYSD